MHANFPTECACVDGSTRITRHRASDFQMTLLGCGPQSWGVLNLRELLTGEGGHQFDTIAQATLILNNVNDQILDLYPAHSILSALES
jgi:hypothetical protein